MQPDLPIDPHTGWRAIAILPSGRVLWPLAGGDGTGESGDSPPTDPPNGPPDKGDPTDWKAEAERWKTHAQKHEKLWKATGLKPDDLPGLPDRLKVADGAKTLEERLAEIETKNAANEARATRAEIATEKGLPLSLAKRLVGSTREELEADADELLKELAAKGGGKQTDVDARRRPTERLRSGGVPDAEPPEENDPRKLAALVPRN